MLGPIGFHFDFESFPFPFDISFFTSRDGCEGSISKNLLKEFVESRDLGLMGGCLLVLVEGLVPVPDDDVGAF